MNDNTQNAAMEAAFRETVAVILRQPEVDKPETYNARMDAIKKFKQDFTSARSIAPTQGSPEEAYNISRDQLDQYLNTLEELIEDIRSKNCKNEVSYSKSVVNPRNLSKEFDESGKGLLEFVGDSIKESENVGNYPKKIVKGDKKLEQLAENCSTVIGVNQDGPQPS